MIPDTDQIKHYIDSRKPKKAGVIGGGFIGLEMAENLASRGVHVTLADQVQLAFFKAAAGARSM